MLGLSYFKTCIWCVYVCPEEIPNIDLQVLSICVYLLIEIGYLTDMGLAK